VLDRLKPDTTWRTLYTDLPAMTIYAAESGPGLA
jgi:hypothetical protein